MPPQPRLRRGFVALCAIVGIAACGDQSSPGDGAVAVTPNHPSWHDSPIRIAYGDDPFQFGDLYLPGSAGDEPLPVVVLIHGGFWRNRYALDLMEPLAEDLAQRGYAAWNIEYRRIGDEGGGWPGTLDDVAAAVDHLAAVATDHSLDLGRVATVGHSAGGHLALWAAGRSAITAGDPGADPTVVPAVAVGQGPVVDLTSAEAAILGSGAVLELLGGARADYPDRYAVATPALSAGPAVFAVVGSADDIVPPEFSSDPNQPGAIDVVTIDGADHFDLIDPAHPAWQAVIDRLPVVE